MKRKLFVIIVISFFLLFSSNTVALNTGNESTKSENQKVTIYVNQYDQNKKLQNTCSLNEISLEKAYQIRDKLLEIEKNFIGSKKIEEQLKILQECGVISSNVTLEYMIGLMRALDHPSVLPRPPLIGPKLIVGGPMMVSHFTLGGRIFGTSILKSLFYKNFTKIFDVFLNGSHIDGVVGVLHMYIGISFKPVYITIIGFNVPKFQKHIFLPFFEVLFPCVGTSIAFVLNIRNSFPLTLFEYNLDVCLIGALGGLGS